MRDQAGRNGETEEARAETGTGEAAERRNREERKGRNGNLSSQSLKRKGPKGNESEEGRRPKEEADARKQKVRPAPGSQLREMNREG